MNRNSQEFVQKIQKSLAELEHVRRHFDCLERVGQALAGSASTEPALQAVVHAAMHGTGLGLGFVALREGPRNPVEVPARIEVEEGLLEHTRTELENTHFVWVIEHGRPLLLHPPGVPVELEEKDVHREHFHAGNFLLVPVDVHGSEFGVLCMGTLERRHVFREHDLRFLKMLATQASGTLRSLRAVEDANQFLISTIRALSAALDARDAYTQGHSERVAMFSLAVVNELESQRKESFPDAFRDAVRLGALLHDIGKIGVPDAILNKPDRLTPEEYEVMKGHAAKGAAIVSSVKNIREIQHCIRHHHENFDGTGYPDGILGMDIPLIARIVGIADAFDAITSDRPYRKGSEPEFALERIQLTSGQQHDPELVQALASALEHGALVAPLDSEEARGEEADHEVLEKLFDRGIKELPSMPQVVHTVIQRTRDPNCTIRELSELVSRDQGLVSRILRVVNSAFYGFSRRISTMSLALTILGMRNIRNLVINVGLAGFFRSGSPESRAARLRLWEHSVETAVGAMTLARLRKMNDPDEAFTAGLLHDIGQITLDYYHRDLALRVEKLVDDEGLTDVEAEARVVGVDHGTIGAWVATQWNLPRALCDAIRYHHDPARCAAESPESLQLTYVVGAAEALSELGNSVDDSLEKHLRTGAVRHLALTEEEIRATLEAMVREKSAMMQVLSQAA